MTIVALGLSITISYTIFRIWLTCVQLLWVSSFNYLMYRLLRKGKADIYLRDDSDREHWQYASLIVTVLAVLTVHCHVLAR